MAQTGGRVFVVHRASARIVVAMLTTGLLVSACYGARTRSQGSGGEQPSAPGPARSEGEGKNPAATTTANALAAAPPPGAASSNEAASEEPLAPLDVLPDAGLRIAFIGDQGVSGSAQSVLELIARERAAAVVHAGDLSYGQTDAAGWEAQLNRILGANFPYLVAAGNHDLDDWFGPRGFEALLRARIARTPGLHCKGEVALKQLCRFRGLEFVLSGVGTYGDNHEWFLEKTLGRPGALVRLCVWHKNQRDMQVGLKTDEVGWKAYRICARHGAPIITGHEHSYARTFTLTELGDRARGHGKGGTPDLITLGRDSTFVVVSGLGGHSARARAMEHGTDTWWASVYANDFQMQNTLMLGTAPTIEFGALFIDFHVEGEPTRACAYFKTVSGKVVDRFELKFPPRSR